MARKNGSIFFHTLATPCIQVAGDGKTAKVTWASPGFEADCGKNVMDGSDHMAVWCWGKYGVDFIKNPKDRRMEDLASTLVPYHQK